LAARRRGTVDWVDPAKDIAELLTSRRAKVTPEQVGLPTYGPRRVKVERGNAGGVSDGPATESDIFELEKFFTESLAPPSNDAAAELVGCGS